MTLSRRTRQRRHQEWQQLHQQRHGMNVATLMGGADLLFNPATYGLVSLWLNDTIGGGAAITADAFGTNTNTNNGSVTAGAALASGLGGSGVFSGTNTLTQASPSGLQYTGGDLWIAAWANLSTSGGVVKNVCSQAAGGGYELRFDAGTHWQFVGSASSLLFATMTAGATAFLFVWANASTGRLYGQSNNGSVTSGVGTVTSASGAFCIGGRSSAAQRFDGSISAVAVGQLPSGALGDGTTGTMTATLNALLYNGGAGRKFPF